MIAKRSVHQVIVSSMMWTACGQAGPSDLTPPPDMVMSDGGASAVSVTVRPNQNLAGFPHAIDMYVPINATIAVLFMHGGGGHKEPFAADLGIKNDTSTTNYDLASDGKAWLAAGYVFLYLPILALIIYSFNDSPIANVWAGFTLKWYASLPNDREIIAGLWLSLRIAFFTACASVVLGTLAAFAAQVNQEPCNELADETCSCFSQ